MAWSICHMALCHTKLSLVLYIYIYIYIYIHGAQQMDMPVLANQ